MSTTTKKQTLKQALHLAATGESKSLARAARALDGKPEGGWGQTEGATRDMENDLPGRWARSYSLAEWIEATHEIVPDPQGQSAGRYRARDLRVVGLNNPPYRTVVAD